MSTSQDFKPKSFIERPEGKTGTVFGIAILGALAFGLYTFFTITYYLSRQHFVLGSYVTSFGRYRICYRRP
jgi:hypothetical protein